jgi:hypothetical protein
MDDFVKLENDIQNPFCPRRPKFSVLSSIRRRHVTPNGDLLLSQISGSATTFFMRVRKIAKNNYVLASSCLSICLSIRMKQLGSH